MIKKRDIWTPRQNIFDLKTPQNTALYDLEFPADCLPLKKDLLAYPLIVILFMIKSKNIWVKIEFESLTHVNQEASRNLRRDQIQNLVLTLTGLTHLIPWAVILNLVPASERQELVDILISLLVKQPVLMFHLQDY